MGKDKDEKSSNAPPTRISRVTLNFVGFPAPNSKSSSGSESPSRRVIAEIPANTKYTLLDLVLFAKRDQLAEDEAVDAERCVFYTSDFAAIPSYSSVGVLRDGEALVVAFNGNSFRDSRSDSEDDKKHRKADKKDKGHGKERDKNREKGKEKHGKKDKEKGRKDKKDRDASSSDSGSESEDIVVVVKKHDKHSRQSSKHRGSGSDSDTKSKKTEHRRSSSKKKDASDDEDKHSRRKSSSRKKGSDEEDDKSRHSRSASASKKKDKKSYDSDASDSKSRGRKSSAHKKPETSEESLVEKRERRHSKSRRDDDEGEIKHESIGLRCSSRNSDKQDRSISKNRSKGFDSDLPWEMSYSSPSMFDTTDIQSELTPIVGTASPKPRKSIGGNEGLGLFPSRAKSPSYSRALYMLTYKDQMHHESDSDTENTRLLHSLDAGIVYVQTQYNISKVLSARTSRKPPSRPSGASNSKRGSFGLSTPSSSGRETASLQTTITALERELDDAHAQIETLVCAVRDGVLMRNRLRTSIRELKQDVAALLMQRDSAASGASCRRCSSSTIPFTADGTSAATMEQGLKADFKAESMKTGKERNDECAQKVLAALLEASESSRVQIQNENLALRNELEAIRTIAEDLRVQVESLQEAAAAEADVTANLFSDRNESSFGQYALGQDVSFADFYALDADAGFAPFADPNVSDIVGSTNPTKSDCKTMPLDNDQLPVEGTFRKENDQTKSSLWSSKLDSVLRRNSFGANVGLGLAYRFEEFPSAMQHHFAFSAEIGNILGFNLQGQDDFEVEEVDGLDLVDRRRELALLVEDGETAPFAAETGGIVGMAVAAARRFVNGVAKRQ
ncbi:hypothetical protein HDU84_004238 [Entophlyctis sp. JEL0112]|nr:hypothetical protein HDU84_004238 [Entophlyctis sp. JEL0112]